MFCHSTKISHIWIICSSFQDTAIIHQQHNAMLQGHLSINRWMWFRFWKVLIMFCHSTKISHIWIICSSFQDTAIIHQQHNAMLQGHWSINRWMWFRFWKVLIMFCHSTKISHIWIICSSFQDTAIIHQQHNAMLQGHLSINRWMWFRFWKVLIMFCHSTKISHIWIICSSFQDTAIIHQQHNAMLQGHLSINRWMWFRFWKVLIMFCHSTKISHIWIICSSFQDTAIIHQQHNAMLQGHLSINRWMWFRFWKVLIMFCHSTKISHIWIICSSFQDTAIIHQQHNAMLQGHLSINRWMWFRFWKVLIMFCHSTKISHIWIICSSFQDTAIIHQQHNAMLQGHLSINRWMWFRFWKVLIMFCHSTKISHIWIICSSFQDTAIIHQQHNAMLQGHLSINRWMWFRFWKVLIMSCHSTKISHIWIICSSFQDTAIIHQQHNAMLQGHLSINRWMWFRFWKVLIMFCHSTKISHIWIICSSFQDTAIIHQQHNAMLQGHLSINRWMWFRFWKVLIMFCHSTKISHIWIICSSFQDTAIIHQQHNAMLQGHLSINRWMWFRFWKVLILFCHSTKISHIWIICSSFQDTAIIHQQHNAMLQGHLSINRWMWFRFWKVLILFCHSTKISHIWIICSSFQDTAIIHQQHNAMLQGHLSINRWMWFRFWKVLIMFCHSTKISHIWIICSSFQDTAIIHQQHNAMLQGHLTINRWMWFRFWKVLILFCHSTKISHIWIICSSFQDTAIIHQQHNAMLQGHLSINRWMWFRFWKVLIMFCHSTKIFHIWIICSSFQDTAIIHQQHNAMLQGHLSINRWMWFRFWKVLILFCHSTKISHIWIICSSFQDTAIIHQQHNAMLQGHLSINRWMWFRFWKVLIMFCHSTKISHIWIICSSFQDTAIIHQQHNAMLQGHLSINRWMWFRFWKVLILFCHSTKISHIWIICSSFQDTAIIHQQHTAMLHGHLSINRTRLSAHRQTIQRFYGKTERVRLRPPGQS